MNQHCNYICCLKSGLYIQTSFCRQIHIHHLQGFVLLFFLQLSAEILVCRDSLTAPLFALLPLYSHASGSLLATSVIHPSFNAYSSNCMFAGAVTSFSCLAFLQPCKPFATHSGRQQRMRDCGSYVL